MRTRLDSEAHWPMIIMMTKHSSSIPKVMPIVAISITRSRSSLGPTMSHSGTSHILGSNWWRVLLNLITTHEEALTCFLLDGLDEEDNVQAKRGRVPSGHTKAKGGNAYEERRSRLSYRLHSGGSGGGLETSRGGACGGPEPEDIKGARIQSHGQAVEQPELGL
jgi:hypothetical protein